MEYCVNSTAPDLDEPLTFDLLHRLKWEFFHKFPMGEVAPHRLARFDLVAWSDFTEHIWWLPLTCLCFYCSMLIFRGSVNKCFGICRPKWLIALWNSWLSIFSLIGAIVTIRTLLYGPHGLLTEGWYPSICGDAQYGFGYTGLFVFLFIYSKIFELFDTYWMVIGARKVICLHWYHHVTVLLYCWHAYSVRTSIGLWFIAMNYLVHAVMYFYFFLSQVRGYCFTVMNRYKGLITILQISQMFVGMGVCTLGLAFYSSGCKCNRMNALFGILMYTTYFVLFIHLFCKQQCKRKKRKETTAEKAKELFNVKDLRFKMKPDETPMRRWAFKDIEWVKSFYLCLVHVGAIWGIYLLLSGQVHHKSMILGIVLYFVGGLGITAGAHRLWTHQSYKATLPMEFFLAFCNSIANQGSIFHWSRDHVVHHKFSETVADPHDARRGFFFSHMGWLLVHKQPEVGLAGKMFSYSWLTNNPVVMLQNRFYTPIAISCCFMFPTWIASHFWDDFEGGLFVAGFLKYVWTLHCTWCVNSLAHLYGYRPYDPEINPSESKLTAYLAMGEGWHNYHHTFPRDYATSEFGILSQYNPTKLFIDACAAFGLAYDLHKEKNPMLAH
jgi:stearoyl-CoA desaturase (delta-9 desaturase)